MTDSPFTPGSLAALTPPPAPAEPVVVEKRPRWQVITHSGMWFVQDTDIDATDGTFFLESDAIAFARLKAIERRDRLAFYERMRAATPAAQDDEPCREDDEQERQRIADLAMRVLYQGPPMDPTP